jgi:hypothetical protein
MSVVGLDWKVLAFGNFSSRPGVTDMIMRNSNNGGMVIYDINNNQVTSARFIGAVGLDWQFAGVAPVRTAGESDLVLRNVNTGAFRGVRYRLQCADRLCELGRGRAGLAARRNRRRSARRRRHGCVG